MDSINTKLDNADTYLAKLFNDGYSNKQRIGEITQELVVAQVDIENNKENVAMLWYSTLSPEALQDIKDWYAANDIFYSNCHEFIKGLQISEGFMGYEGTMGDTLVIDYGEKGYQVMKNTGEVFCYKQPITEMTPEPVPCESMCIDEEGSEE